MENLTLREQILSFIRSVNVVEQKQLTDFFSNWGNNNVDFEIKKLLFTRQIYNNQTSTSIPAGVICSSHVIPAEMKYQIQSTIRALTIVTNFYKSDDIKAIFLEKYPNEISFITTKDILYDVVIMDSRTWAQKYVMLKKLRPTFLPDPENDPCNHLAIVDCPELVPKLKDLSFAMFLEIDRNGHVSIIDEDEQ